MRLRLTLLCATVLFHGSKLARSEAAPVDGVPSKPANLPLIAPHAAARLENPESRKDLIAALNLPADFVRRTGHRLTFDQYAQRFHAVAGNTSPIGRPPVARRQGDERFVKLLPPQTPEPVLKYRLAQERRGLTLRGFRAPILEAADKSVPEALSSDGLSQEQQKAAEFIARRLAHDGLIATLVEAVVILGPQKLLAKPAAAAEALSDLGFPVDWLRSFELSDHPSGKEADWVLHVARQLSNGQSVDKLKTELEKVRFQFQRSSPAFRVAPENGETEIGLVRMQVEGGYVGGIVPGDSLDVTAQIVAALPGADFQVTIQQNFATNLLWLAQHCWPLKRTDQLTILAESCDVSPWPQDNGKAGFVDLHSSGAVALATLVPRYASQGEDVSLFMPGDSYLMDGLRSTGHSVVQSPLLFQGGNLLAVHDPVANRRVLLISEAEIYRNTALGLTRDQVLEAFRQEFGVDACVTLPVVSHHLDFDVSVRTHRGQVLAFVNDPQTAVRLILERGLAALEVNRNLRADDAQTARASLREGKSLEFAQALSTALQRYLNPERQYSRSLTKAFATDRNDSAAGNFQCFLAASDILWSAALTESRMPSDELARNYFVALRELEEARQTQIRELTKLGWKVMPIPSLPDMYRTINYVNGLQDRTRYLMPAYGGFYSFLDAAAMSAFKQALGSEVSIVPIFTAASQRNHGAVHCAASAYPRQTSGKN